jgi:hypothetical protein
VRRVAELDARPLETVEVYASTRRGKVTVAAYAPGWLEGQALLEANSVEIARSALKRIMPHLGGMAREDVTPDDVRRMLAALKKSSLSDGTVSRTLDVARQLLPKAATEGVRYRIKERRRAMLEDAGVRVTNAGNVPRLDPADVRRRRGRYRDLRARRPGHPASPGRGPADLRVERPCDARPGVPRRPGGAGGCVMTNLATRVDLRTMTSCCVRTAQRLPELPAEGDTAGCQYGKALEVADGRWRVSPARA